MLASQSPSAITLGRYWHGKEEFGDPLAYSGERNLLVLGPNGSGKGTRFLVPALLSMREASVVIIDPKAELAALTALARRKFSDVVIINPFGVLLDDPRFADLQSVGFNPMRALDPRSLSFNADAGWLAEALIALEGNDPHWPRSARKLIAGLIMYARLLYGDKAHLGHVRQWLTEPAIPPAKGKDDEPDRPGRGLPQTALDMMRLKPEPGIDARIYAALRMKAGQFTRWNNREVESIISTADSQTEAFDDAEISDDLQRLGIDFRELKTRPMTVYVILPPDMMERHGRWLRLVISSALRAVMRRRKPGERRVFFLMDEFAALGRLEIVETTWALVRGYGIQLVPVLQDLNQLKELYKDRWESFLGMAGVVLGFGPNDNTTANWMSERSGDKTDIVRGYSAGEIAGRLDTTQGVSYQQVKVPALDRKRLFDTPEGHGYVWLAGRNDPVPVYLPGYWEIAAFDGIARPNPYREAD